MKKLGERQMRLMLVIGIIDAIFILRQMIEKYEIAERKLYMVLIWKKSLIVFQER